MFFEHHFHNGSLVVGLCGCSVVVVVGWSLDGRVVVVVCGLGIWVLDGGVVALLYSILDSEADAIDWDQFSVSISVLFRVYEEYAGHTEIEITFMCHSDCVGG